MTFSLLSPLESESLARSYADSLPLRVRQRYGSNPLSVSLGVIGGGLMGTAIAATHLKATPFEKNSQLVICEQSESVLEQLPQRLAAELTLQNDNDERKGAQTSKSAMQTYRDNKELIDNVKFTQNLDSLLACEVIIETIPEKLKLKQKLYKKLEELHFDGLLFSNTSTIEVSRLAEKLVRPERFCGFHFFHPVRKRSLLEIVRGRRTANETIEAAQHYAIFLKKTPITVDDGAGFLVNRILNPLLRESLALFDAGVSLMRIENVAQRVGMTMGPFRMIDEIGLDVTLHAGWVLNQAFPQRAYVSETLIKLIENGRIGRKTSVGFFQYSSDISWNDEGTIDERLTHFLPHLSETTARKTRSISDEEIAQRLFLPMIAEAVRIVEQGIVCNFWEIDLAVVLGLGFPQSRGGLCFWANQLGWDRIFQRLLAMQQSLGPRFEPPQWLKDYTNLKKTLDDFSF